MRAMSRSRKVPVTIVSPPDGARISPPNKNGPQGPPKTKSPAGGFTVLCSSGVPRESVDVAGGTGLPPPPARSEPRGAAHHTGTRESVGTPAWRPDERPHWTCIDRLRLKVG